jgi:hypothetical protein
MVISLVHQQIQGKALRWIRRLQRATAQPAGVRAGAAASAVPCPVDVARFKPRKQRWQRVHAVIDRLEWLHRCGNGDGSG